MTHALARCFLTALLALGSTGVVPMGMGTSQADEPGPSPGTPIPAPPQGPQPTLENRSLAPAIRRGPAVRHSENHSDTPHALLQQHLQTGDRILPADWEPHGHIHGRWSEQTLLRPGEMLLVYLEQPATAGSNFMVYRPGMLLTDPASGEVMGRLAHNLGRVQITGERQGEAWRARLMTMQDALQVGDLLLRDPDLLLDFQPHNRLPAPVSGRVLWLPDDMEMGGTYQVMVVGLGRRDQVSQGLSMTIQHQAAPGMDPVRGERVQDKAHPIGEATLFLIGEKASFALVGPTTHPVSRGDTLHSR
ncbi:MAG: hypothetical protein HQL88_01325 [Magnetococcales bacterium]|nr:hypothetical protein [Magnetococcales bacterium]